MKAYSCHVQDDDHQGRDQRLRRRPCARGASGRDHGVAGLAIRRMTALAERESRFTALKAAMEANPPDELYRAELADWESDAWN